MDYANIHPIIGALCSRPEGGVDVDMYRALTSEMSIEEALDLYEVDQVGRSWRAAMQANLDSTRAMNSAKAARKAGR